MPACDLLFAAEAEAAIGVEIGEAQELVVGQPEGGGWLTDCVYWRHVSHERAPLELTLASGGAFLSQFERLKGHAGVTAVSGLGDEALLRMARLAGLDEPVGALFVRLGDTVLGLSLGIADVTEDGGLVLAGDGPTQEQILLGLARTAVDRLVGPPVVTANTCDYLSAAEASALAGLAFATSEDADEHDAWGPSCRYRAEDRLELFVSVNTTPASRANFDTCKALGEATTGLGDEAFYARPNSEGACTVRVGFDFIAFPLLVRSSETIVTIGNNETTGTIAAARWREAAPAIAREVLQNLGVAPGATPPPVSADALLQPCALASDAEVSSIIGVVIAQHFDSVADAAARSADCYYATAVVRFQPLHVRVSHGDQVVREFAAFKDRGYEALQGLGDEAYWAPLEGETDTPLVQLVVRRGNAVLELTTGAIDESTTTFLGIAPGDPEEQLVMLRGLAELILPRIFS